MNFKKYSILIVLIIYLLGCTHNVEKQNEVVEVNYLSFQIETYSPVTTESISNTTYKKIFLNKKEIIEIYALLKQVKSPLTFYNNKVRLKMLMPNKEIIYIEKDGTVLIGKIVKKLDMKGLKKLEKILDIDLGSKVSY